MTKKVITFSDNSTHTVHYENSDDNTVVKFDVPDTENANKKQTITSHSKTDSFGRKIFDELQIGRGFVSRQFSYMPGAITDEHKKQHLIKSTATTQLVSHIALSDGRTISYEYDDEERIIKVTDTIDGTVSYTYDALGQLEIETKDGITTKFEYDNYGNITAKAKGIIDEDGEFVEESKITYEYGNEVWRDLLTAYNGQSITYDAQGNPLTYLGHTLEWEKGRQLKSFDGNTYTYNANGIRTSKIVNGIKHKYTLDGTKILRETWNGNTLIPLYDNEDGVCGILYNNVPYYFIKNLQGDVIALVDKDAKTVARYSYDAWGAVTSAVTYTELTKGVDIAAINPFRYRGYYYDEEIGLYYLQSRYYDESIGRFINADDSVIVGIPNGETPHNIFTYCENDPVLNSDYQGFFVIRRWMVSAIADFLLGLIPGIGPLFAPVKTVAKAYGKAALKSKLAGPLGSFVKFVARNASKLLNGLKNGLSKLWGVGRWLASKIPVGTLTSMLAGLTSSVVINKFLNIIVPNIDIILSLGGLLSGVLDYIFDKSLNNSIWVI